MDIEREIKVRDAIKYCIENFDSKTATNRIVEFWKDELELQQKQCNIANVSGSYFEVDFGGHLKAQMIIEDGKLKVTAAMNGWGDPVDVSTVRFIL